MSLFHVSTVLLVASCTLAACSSESTVSSSDFTIRTTGTDLTLVEGDRDGMIIPLRLSRQNGHDRPVTLGIRGRSVQDVAFVTSSFSDLELTAGENSSEAVLRLSISDAPILEQQRDFFITASDGVSRDSTLISVTVKPTSAPDVYLLAGQSNMVGFSGDGTRQAEPGGADAPDERIKQLNVSKNNESDVFTAPDDYVSVAANVVAPDIVTALDPLHIPQDPTAEHGKDVEYIGLGLTFAKSALNNTEADIVLVPAAWSGSSFCQNSEGPRGGWLAEPSSDANFSNTLLFERAVTRANTALAQTGGVFRGILWHQGESDSNDRCASAYTDNLTRLVEGFRSQIQSVGSADLLRAEGTFPFVLGTMSRGSDDREERLTFLEPQRIVDEAHRNFPDIMDKVALSIHDDLVPPAYPCGNTSCIHFGPDALREMGNRYYGALLDALDR